MRKGRVVAGPPRDRHRGRTCLLNPVLNLVLLHQIQILHVVRSERKGISCTVKQQTIADTVSHVRAHSTRRAPLPRF
jgi:hypothetical protein